MPKVAGQRRETPRRKKRRNEIYDVAIQVFNRKGYATASVQEIADEIGVLKGSLYYYIDSKEDLLQGIYLDFYLCLSLRLAHCLQLLR